MKPIWIDAKDMSEEEPEEPVSGETIDVVEAAAAAPPPTPSLGVIVDLASMPAKAILNEQALARALGVTQRTIRRMVQRNELPPPIPLAGQAVWFAGRVLEHAETRAARAEKDAGRRQAARERLLSA
jgi:predicted DNA-binding transcriptional regulator AlpA